MKVSWKDGRYYLRGLPQHTKKSNQGKKGLKPWGPCLRKRGEGLQKEVKRKHALNSGKKQNFFNRMVGLKRHSTNGGEEPRVGPSREGRHPVVTPLLRSPQKIRNWYWLRTEKEFKGELGEEKSLQRASGTNKN